MTPDLDSSGAHALVIEDDPLMADLLRHYLIELGYRSVDVAHGALTAITSVCKRQPDLVVADILLQDGTNGLEVARRIHHRSSVPLVFVSSLPELAKHEINASVLDKKTLSPASLSVGIEDARAYC